MKISEREREAEKNFLVRGNQKGGRLSGKKGGTQISKLNFGGKIKVLTSKSA